jgi:hypothetical protein
MQQITSIELQISVAIRELVGQDADINKLKGDVQFEKTQDGIPTSAYLQFVYQVPLLKNPSATQEAIDHDSEYLNKRLEQLGGDCVVINVQRGDVIVKPKQAFKVGQF